MEEAKRLIEELKGLVGKTDEKSMKRQELNTSIHLLMMPLQELFVQMADISGLARTTTAM